MTVRCPLYGVVSSNRCAWCCAHTYMHKRCCAYTCIRGARAAALLPLLTSKALLSLFSGTCKALVRLY